MTSQSIEQVVTVGAEYQLKWTGEVLGCSRNGALHTVWARHQEWTPLGS